MIIINPEFHRNLWLNFSPFRLIVMPVLLALVLYVFSSQGAGVWQASVFMPAMFCYYIVVFFWGNHAAASASNNDVDKNTWDFQRMSSLTPWDLLIGKLFGATSYVWYAGLMLLGVIAYSYGFAIDAVRDNQFGITFPTLIELLVYLIFSGVMGHAVAFFLGTHGLKQNKSDVAASFIVGVFVSFTVSSLTIGDFIKNGFGGGKIQGLTGADTTWHFLTISEQTFLICSLLFFFFWIIMAIQRNLRDELQYRNSPIVFMLFVITISLYATGHLNSNIHYNEISLWQEITSKSLIAFFIIVFFTYFTMLMDAASLAKYKRWAYAMKAKEWKRAFENTPAWVGCAVLLIPVYIFANLGVSEGMEKLGNPLNGKFSILALTTAIILFTLRDGLVYHSIFLGKIERHKGFMLGIYLLTMYGLLPFFVTTIIKGMVGAGLIGHSNIKQVAFDVSVAFYPLGGSSIVIGCVPILIQCILAFTVFRYVFKSLKV